MWASVGLLVAATAAAPPDSKSHITSARTVMAWVSTDPANWPTCRDFLTTGAGKGAVNAISIDNLYTFHPENGTLSRDLGGANIAAQQKIWASSFRLYPMIGYGGNVTGLHQLFAAPEAFIGMLVKDAVEFGWAGINIDFEPSTNMDDSDPRSNPSIDDAVGLAVLLDKLGAALHAVNKTVSVDTMSAQGACWSQWHHADGEHGVDPKPCPWIRRFWDLDALSSVRNLDRLISMGTYTDNNTEYPLDLNLNQLYFPIERYGVGLCPLGCGHPQPTERCVGQRLAAAVQYGATEIDLWSMWDSTAANWSVVEAAWQPWIKPLQNFLAGEDQPFAEHCWAG